jgi:CHASE3 domain sensor protein
VNIKSKFVAALAGVVLLVSMGMFGAFWAFHQTEEAGAARTRSTLVVASANALLSAMKDAETGQQGFVITGSEDFLQPYLLVRDCVQQRIDDLQQLVEGTASLKYLNIIEPVLMGKLTDLSQVIDLRRRHDLKGAVALANTGQGKRYMDDVRRGMGEFIKIEGGTLAQHEADFEQPGWRPCPSTLSSPWRDLYTGPRSHVRTRRTHARQHYFASHGLVRCLATLADRSHPLYLYDQSES